MAAPWEGQLDKEQAQNYFKIKAAAQKYSIPEIQLLGLLWQEGGFRTDPGGNGGGIGQVSTGAASDMGITGDKYQWIRQDADTGIDVAARYFQARIKQFGGDFDKARASYFVGPNNVDAAVRITTGAGKPQDWLKALDKIASEDPEIAKQGSVTDYLAKTSGGEISGKTKSSDDILRARGFDPSTNKPFVSVPTDATPKPAYDPNTPPNPADYYRDLSDGVKTLDKEAFAAAQTNWLDYQKVKASDRAEALAPISKYMDDIIDQIGKEVAVGNMDLSKANSVFKARTDSYKAALDAFNGDSFKYGAPADAQYTPGREPGGYFESIGLKPLVAQHGQTLDPMQEALDSFNQAKAGIDAVKTPGIPDFAMQRWNMTRPGEPLPGSGVQGLPPPPVQPGQGTLQGGGQYAWNPITGTFDAAGAFAAAQAEVERQRNMYGREPLAPGAGV